MFKFKLLGGNHIDEKGRQYVRGDIITTNHDLAASFGAKFLTLEKETEKEVASEPVVEESEQVMKHGEDVTDKFPKASDNGFIVFQKGAYFHVVDADAPEKRLNKKGLSKTAATAFIKKLI